MPDLKGVFDLAARQRDAGVIRTAFQDVGNGVDQEIIMAQRGVDLVEHDEILVATHHHVARRVKRCPAPTPIGSIGLR